MFTMKSVIAKTTYLDIFDHAYIVLELAN